MLPECEEATIRAFILAERRPRYLSMLADAKKRRRFLDRLNHCRDIDERFAVPVAAEQCTLSELRVRGAPSKCHLVSDAVKLDGQEMDLADALVATEEAGWGTVICCIPGSLAYFHDESGLRRWLLVRPIQEVAHL